MVVVRVIVMVMSVTMGMVPMMIFVPVLVGMVVSVLLRVATVAMMSMTVLVSVRVMRVAGATAVMVVVFMRLVVVIGMLAMRGPMFMGMMLVMGMAVIVRRAATVMSVSVILPLIGAAAAGSMVMVLMGVMVEMIVAVTGAATTVLMTIMMVVPMPMPMPMIVIVAMPVMMIVCMAAAAVAVQRLMVEGVGDAQPLRIEEGEGAGDQAGIDPRLFHLLCRHAFAQQCQRFIEAGVADAVDEQAGAGRCEQHLQAELHQGVCCGGAAGLVLRRRDDQFGCVRQMEAHRHVVRSDMREPVCVGGGGYRLQADGTLVVWCGACGGACLKGDAACGSQRLQCLGLSGAVEQVEGAWPGQEVVGAGGCVTAHDGLIRRCWRPATTGASAEPETPASRECLIVLVDPRTGRRV